MSDFWAALEALSTLGAVILAGWALHQTRRIFEEQQKQTQKIYEEQEKRTQSMHNEQINLVKLQAFIPVSDQLSLIRYIDPDDPYRDDLVQSANSLEKLAVVWDKEMIPRDILTKVYSRLFVTVFEQIFVAKDKNTGEYIGRDILLNDCPSTTILYDVWYKRHRDASIFRTLEMKEGNK